MGAGGGIENPNRMREPFAAMIRKRDEHPILRGGVRTQTRGGAQRARRAPGGFRHLLARAYRLARVRRPVTPVVTRLQAVLADTLPLARGAFAWDAARIPRESRRAFRARHASVARRACTHAGRAGAVPAARAPGTRDRLAARVARVPCCARVAPRTGIALRTGADAVPARPVAAAAVPGTDRWAAQRIAYEPVGAALALGAREARFTDTGLVDACAMGAARHSCRIETIHGPG